MAGAALPAAASAMDAGRAAGHAYAAENRAAEAMVDRASGNPIGAAINENRAMSHSIASNVAQTKSNVEAGIAGSNLMAGAMGPAGAMGAATAAGVGMAAGAGMARNAAAAAAMSGAGPYGYGPMSVYPGVYGAAYGMPAYGMYGPAGMAGPLGYGAGTGRAMATGAAAATGAALANGLAGSALGSGLGATLGVSY